MKKYLIGTCVVNEGEKIKRMMRKLENYPDYDVLIIDDGSTDDSLKEMTGVGTSDINNLRKTNVDLPTGQAGILTTGLNVNSGKVSKFPSFKIIRHATNQGAGACIRQILFYAQENSYEAVFFISGNDKDDPEDMGKLKKAVEAGYDFVQGSRYIKGGEFGGMPFYRKISTQCIHPILFSLITGKKITDSTNGFRAVRLSLLDDQRINLNQSWLDHYELEPYLFYKAITLGYKVTEVPVRKIYPPKREGYTKMKPFSGWWSILRPLIYLGLGLKK